MTETRTEPRMETTTLDAGPFAPSRRRVARSGLRRKPPARAGVPVSSQHGQPEIIAVIEARRGAWSAPDLAELLGCSGKHIYALAKSGRMPHLRIDGMIRFDPGATAQWLRERFIAA
jgi:excisionase family DNA binding protein